MWRYIRRYEAMNCCLQKPSVSDSVITEALNCVSVFTADVSSVLTGSHMAAGAKEWGVQEPQGCCLNLSKPSHRMMTPLCFHDLDDLIKCRVNNLLLLPSNALHHARCAHPDRSFSDRIRVQAWPCYRCFVIDLNYSGTIMLYHI